MKEDLRKTLNEKLTVPLWPTAGEALDLTRGSTYSAARRGEIATIKFGKCLKVPTAWLKTKLGLNEPAA